MTERKPDDRGEDGIREKVGPLPCFWNDMIAKGLEGGGLQTI
jgi:hypothetical protein